MVCFFKELADIDKNNKKDEKAQQEIGSTDQDGLALLIARYTAALPTRLDEMAHALQAVKHNPNDASILTEARIRAHKLRGTAGSHGFISVGEAMATIEDTLLNLKSLNADNAFRTIDQAMDNAMLSAQQSCQPDAKIIPQISPTRQTAAAPVLIKVLFVDDDPTVQLAAQMAIKTQEPKWEVILASSGQEGIDKAIEEKPDLIVLDMIMPGMDGRATLTKLRQNSLTAHIPVIFLTAMMQRQEADSYLALGVLGVIAKPFDPLTLSAALTEMAYSK